MPYLLGPHCNRRTFLKTAALSTGALLTGACARLGSIRREIPAEAHWALLSDIHVSLDAKEKNSGFAIDDNFKTAVAQVRALNPEGALVCGDCARLEGRDGDYEMLFRLAEPLYSAMPTVFVMGNHDDRAKFQKQFKEHAGESAPVKNKYIRALDVPSAGIRLIGLDSLLYTNKTAGWLGKVQRDWLAEELDKRPNTPAFVFVHHTFGEGEGHLLDKEAFFPVVLAHRQVKAVFYGHSHVYAYDRMKDLHLINIPAVAYSFSKDQPIGWVDARFTRDGGEFTLRAIGSNMADNAKTTSLAWR